MTATLHGLKQLNEKLDETQLTPSSMMHQQSTGTQKKPKKRIFLLKYPTTKKISLMMKKKPRYLVLIPYLAKTTLMPQVASTMNLL